jgi:hypothetical protein
MAFGEAVAFGFGPHFFDRDIEVGGVLGDRGGGFDYECAAGGSEFVTDAEAGGFFRAVREEAGAVVGEAGAGVNVEGNEEFVFGFAGSERDSRVKGEAMGSETDATVGVEATGGRGRGAGSGEGGADGGGVVGAKERALSGGGGFLVDRAVDEEEEKEGEDEDSAERETRLQVHDLSVAGGNVSSCR